MGQGAGLVELFDVIHSEGDAKGAEVRRLKDVRIVKEDEWGFTVRRMNGEEIRLSKRAVLRIEPAGNGSRGGQRGY